MILCQWDAPEGNADNIAYTCMLLYPIIVSHLRFSFLCLLLLYSIYLCGCTGTGTWSSACVFYLCSHPADNVGHHDAPLGVEGETVRVLTLTIKIKHK